MLLIVAKWTDSDLLPPDIYSSVYVTSDICQISSKVHLVPHAGAFNHPTPL